MSLFFFFFYYYPVKGNSFARHILEASLRMPASLYGVRKWRRRVNERISFGKAEAEEEEDNDKEEGEDEEEEEERKWNRDEEEEDCVCVSATCKTTLGWAIYRESLPRAVSL